MSTAVYAKRHPPIAHRLRHITAQTKAVLSTYSGNVASTRNVGSFPMTSGQLTEIYTLKKMAEFPWNALTWDGELLEVPEEWVDLPQRCPDCNTTLQICKTLDDTPSVRGAAYKRCKDERCCVHVIFLCSQMRQCVVTLRCATLHAIGEGCKDTVEKHAYPKDLTHPEK